MTWTTRTAETAIAAAAGLGLAVGAFVVPDLPGRLLLAGAAALLLGLAVRDLVQRPRLVAGPDGVTVRRLGGSVHLPWPRLRVRVRESRRFGLRLRTLEIDTPVGAGDDDLLVILGRRDLGADPAGVARRLGELDPTGS